MFAEYLTAMDLFAIVGGVSGFIIALTIMKPLNRFTFLGRFFTAITLAFASAEPILNFMGYVVTGDTVMLVSMVVGAFGWFVFSILLKTIASAKNFKELISSFWERK